MAGNSVKIRIDGDASDLQKELSTVERSAKSAASALGHEYARAGMSLSEGMRKAWAEVQKAQKSGQTIVINGVETIISNNEKIIKQKNDLGDIYDEMGNSAKAASTKVKAGLADIKAGIDMAAAAARTLYGVAEKGIGYNASIEQLKTSFEVMTGSAEKAAEVVDRLRVMGAETPFETKDLASTTQLLMQYGFTADEALDRMRMLGDVAQGNVQAMNSIALGYAQMASAGKVNLVDIKQMINGGFNPLQEISERTGESMASLYDRISKGKISVDEITESMRHATSEGGRFYQSMEKQSQTLSGQLSTLKDNADQLLGSLTEGVSEGLRDQILPFTNNLVAELQSAFDSGGYQGLVDTATDMIPDLLGMMTGELQKGIEGLSRWLPQGATQLMQALPSALRSASVVTPQLTQALFEVASTVVGDLVSMLPELTPTLLTGFVDLSESILRGSVKVFESTIRGIENALHDGQTKIAGIWVDDESIAKYDFDVDVDVHEESIEEEIEEAKSTVEGILSQIQGINASEIAEAIISGDVTDALEDTLVAAGVSPKDAQNVARQIEEAQKIVSEAVGALGLSEEISAKITEMAASGASQSDLTEYIKSLGVEEGVAADTALKITNASASVNGAISKLPEDVRASISGLTFADDRETLVAALQLLELNPESIQGVLDSFDTTSGLLTAGVRGIFDGIGTMLTDGLPDTEEVLGSLEGDVRRWAQEAHAKINEWYESEIESLNASGKNGQEYDSALLDIENKAASMRDSVQASEVGAIEFMNSMAGKSTEYVRQHLSELEAIGQTAVEISEEIDALTGKVRSAAEAAFQVVRSGANADQATISQAIKFKVTEFNLDEQAAEDAYNATVETLNEQLAKKDISKDEFNTAIETAQGDLNAAKLAAKQALETALREIFTGIAESEGIENNAAELAEKIGLAEVLMNSVEQLSDTGLLGDQLGAGLTEQLAAHMQIDPDLLRNMPVDAAASALEDWAAQLYLDATSGIESLDNSKLVATYAAALEEGMLAGTSFDTSETALQIENLLIGMWETAEAGSASAQSKATSTAVGVATTAAQEEKKVMDEGGESAGNWLDIGAARGIRNGASSVLNAAVSVARSVVSAFKNILGIASPSKVMMEIGQFTGEGYAIGLEKSMQNAVDTAKRMTGQVTTAASIKMRSEVVVPGMQVDMQHALENSTQPVNLYVNGRQLGKVMAADNQQAQNTYNRSIALGVGK